MRSRVLTGQSIIVDGTLTVNGTLDFAGRHAANNRGGTLINNGSLNHRTPVGRLDRFRTSARSPTTGRSQWTAGATLKNYNVFTNAATLTVKGQLVNTVSSPRAPYGSFTNTGTLLLSNSSGASDQGTFFAASDTSNTNHGTMTINDAHSAMYMPGSLTNHGEIPTRGLSQQRASPTRAQVSSTTMSTQTGRAAAPAHRALSTRVCSPTATSSISSKTAPSRTRVAAALSTTAPPMSASPSHLDSVPAVWSIRAR